MSEFVGEAWRETRLKNLFSARIGGSWGDEPEEDNSFICIRAADFVTDRLCHRHVDLTRRCYEKSEVERKRLLPGDLIIEKSGGGDNQPVGRVISFDLPEIALCSNFLEILRPDHKQLYQRYGAYLMYSLWVQRFVTRSIKQTTGIQNLDEEAYLDIKIKLPSLQKQRFIADHLDRETAKIDAMIAAKEHLLELLAEKRRALIAHAVTCGLNPGAPMRDPGTPWLGQIPAHWKTERARWLFRERDQRSVSGEEELLTVSHLTGVTPRSEKDVNMFEAETTEGYKLCKAGDLVINTMWAWMGAMGVSPVDGIVSPSYNVYTPCDSLDPNYVDAIVRIPVFPQEATRYSKGVWSSRLRLYPEGFYEIWFPVPPIPEQQTIVTHIQQETSKLDALKQAAERTIDLLKERRKALISEAVTGRIEVGGAT